jgi:hypothetical protein
VKIDTTTPSSMQSNSPQRGRRIVGWITVVAATTVASFLGFWGIIENFHEGWHHPTLLLRLAFTLAYLSFMFVFMLLSIVSLRWPWMGCALHIGIALFALWFFHTSPAATQMFFIPAVVLGLGYLWGRPEPRRWAYRLIVAVPLVTVFISGAEPAWRVAHRFDDGDRGARHLNENGVDLVWAPKGPGWQTQGMSWFDAVERCRHLTADGLDVADTPQDIWRLPTAEEAVRSQCRGGKNAGGQWNAQTAAATYRVRPDKESPLWDLHSQVVYWWTATEANDGEVYIIVYDGKVWRRPKTAPWGYLGFRAVKSHKAAN